MSFQKQKLEQKFREEYNKLNDQQRRAVDTIEGPVMVIAGPGTGKTQILASRIGKILLDTDTAPENILCLTYTDAGVVAMRKRLLQFIGPDAYKVNIFTFHAFCNDVIQDNLSLFEKNSLDPVSELEKIQLLKQLIDAFPKAHPLKRYRGDVYYEVKNLDHLFSTMKREGWSPSFIQQRIEEYVKDLPLQEKFIYKTSRKGRWEAGDLKPDYYDELERMKKLSAAVNEFESFQQMMRQKNLYDFDDMINWVIKAFEENKNLLLTYQERFQYILVDEFQDTSGTQNKIVSLLINYWDKPNVFVVGDDDQSIYRFQGANIENMLEFANQYKNDLHTVVLTNNYRSIQPILDFSKTMIASNRERLINKLDGLSKDLITANENIKHLTHKPLLLEFDTQQQEMMGIVKQVQQLVEKGVSSGEIGIIYKEHKYGDELTRYFTLLNLPVYSKRHINLLDLPLVQKIVLLFQYLAAEHDAPYGGDEMLFELLHFSWFGIAPIEIAKLSIEVAEQNYTDKKTSLRRALSEKGRSPAKDLFSAGNEKMQQASEVMEQLIADVPNVTLQTLFENVIRTTGLFSELMASEERHWNIQVLTAFFDFIKEENLRDKTLDLKKLVALISLMKDEGISLPLVQVTGSDKGVNLMTVHGSKGLEFEYVFFAGCNSAFWEKKRTTNRGFKFPVTIFDSAGGAATEEELRRLFYVAMTRARLHLFLSYSNFKNDGKQLEPSMFISELIEQHELIQEKVAVSPEVQLEFASLQFASEHKPEIEKLEKVFVERRLEKFVMNVTALNNYLKCPLEFYYKNLVRIPAPKNEATEFGSAAHHALECLFKKMQDSKDKIFPGREEFIADFEWYMLRHRENFTQGQFNRRMEYGREVLGNYYDTHISSFNKVVVIERNIRNVVVKDVPIKGKLDKLEFDGKMVNVVDYKTGNPKNAVDKLKEPDAKNPLGGDYWRQAVFYKILVDNDSSRDWKAVSSEFDFIEPDDKKIYIKKKLAISPADITTVTQQITDTWQKIQAHDFYTGCGKEDCHWCNFVKTNNLAITLHEIVDEEEES